MAEALNRFPPASGPLAAIDLGSGDGAFAEALVGHLGKRLSLTLLDPSPAMLKAAAAQLGPGRARLVVGDLDHAPAAENGYDVVIAAHLLEHLPEPVAALARMVASCALGGSWSYRSAARTGAVAWSGSAGATAGFMRPRCGHCCRQRDLPRCSHGSHRPGHPAGRALPTRRAAVPQKEVNRPDTWLRADVGSALRYRMASGEWCQDGSRKAWRRKARPRAHSAAFSWLAPPPPWPP
jgi:SAM-dependent methyltransferase